MYAWQRLMRNHGRRCVPGYVQRCFQRSRWSQETTKQAITPTPQCQQNWSCAIDKQACDNNETWSSITSIMVICSLHGERILWVCLRHCAFHITMKSSISFLTSTTRLGSLKSPFLLFAFEAWQSKSWIPRSRYSHSGHGDRAHSSNMSPRGPTAPDWRRLGRRP